MNNDIDFENTNVLFVTLDSCRFDTAEQANIPVMRSVGTIKRAFTHASYTVPAHTAFFSGHLPNVFGELQAPFYSESIKQLWRIKTSPGKDKNAGLVFSEPNILDGYRKLGFYVLGVGGVTQFSDGAFLRQFFKDNFLYYGNNLDEEPLAPRNHESFPLSHISEIVKKLENKEKWFLFINCPETHYPYDYGKGIANNIKKYYSSLFSSLNLREDNKISIADSIYREINNMQIAALEYVDTKLGELIEAVPRTKDLLVIICGDHGENFGESFEGRKRWGHLFPSNEVMQVPLVIGVLRNHNVI